jgi:hypothetical protein
MALERFLKTRDRAAQGRTPDANIRGTGVHSILDGICSETGYRPDLQFLANVRRHRDE